MRNLTSVQSATNVLLDIEFHLQAADVSTTWIFTSRDIPSYPGVGWEIDYTGGLGKPSNYNITLSTSMGFIGGNYNKLIQGKSFLKVFVNSDNFTPHVGRVRGLKRDASNPNLIDLVVYDDFLDGNPKVPVEAFADSYSILHPNVSNVDMGYPLYYGKHTRPFYMTPVDCSIKTLLGPRNVSSENHVSSVYAIVNGQNNLYKGAWAQQSGGTNQVSSSLFYDCYGTDSYNVFWSFGAIDSSKSTTQYFADSADVGSGTGVGQGNKWAVFYHGSLGYQANYEFYYSLESPYFYTHRASHIYYNVDVHSLTYTSSEEGFAFTNLRDSLYYKRLFPTQSNSYHYFGNVTVPSSFTAFLQYGGNTSILHHFHPAGTAAWTPSNVQNSGNAVLFISSLNFDFQFKSQAYDNYSIFSNPVATSDIAISENPNGIIADITNQTSFNFVTVQNSTAQAETSSFNFQCYLDVRQNFSDLLQNFGEISGTYYWVGDSGYLNTRTYQESATLANSIDYTITTSDIIEGSLVIRDNPIGSIFYQTAKARKVKIEYDYDYTTDKYTKSLTLDKLNNAFCNSADAAGVQKEVSLKTKYIKETQTASYYADNVVRRYTLNETILEGLLPARFMGMELADALYVKHPSLLNSESLFQVTKVDPNYGIGFIKFTANEILNLN